MEQITSCIEDSLRIFIAHHLTTLSWSMKKLIIVAAFLHVSFLLQRSLAFSEYRTIQLHTKFSQSCILSSINASISFWTLS
jgi:hypothetical protein